MKKTLFISILCFFTIYQNISAQDEWTSYEYQTGNTGASGLIGQYVYCFLSDNQNRLWIGTESGISIKSESGWEWLTTSDGLKVNEVGNMVMDHNNNIWIGYGSYLSGVSVYNNGSFTHYTTNDHLLNNKIEDLMVDKDGNVWIASQGGINKFDGSNWESFSTADGLTTDKILSLDQDQEGNIWIGTEDKGVWVYDGNSFSANCWESNSDNMVTDIFVDSENKVWAVSAFHAYVYDRNTWAEINPIQPGVNAIAWKVTEDNNGNFFFATTMGVSLFRDSKWEYFTPDDGLGSDNNLSLFVDSSNTIYSGSERGFATFNGENWDPITTEGLINNNVYDIFKDSEDKIWFCTHGGISILDGENWEYFDQTPNNNKVEWVSKGLQDKNGDYWFATVNGIYKYNTNGWTIFDSNTNDIFSGWGKDILEDYEGNLWFATMNYLLKYDGENWIHYTDEDGFRSNYVNAIYEASDSIIWFGTRGGVSYWDGSKFIHNTIANPKFDEAVIYSFVEDTAHNLIACTINGLLIYKDGIWDIWEKAPEIWFFDSYKDKNDILWFASNNGLYKYDGNSFYPYTMDDGLVSNVIQRIYREEDTGAFWFATNNGVSKLAPDIVAQVSTNKSLLGSHSIQIETEGITQPYQFSINSSDFEKNDGIYESLDAGDYTFAVTNAYDTLIINYTVSELQTGITDIGTPLINIYPNPTKGFINITGGQLTKVEIFALSGQLIFSENLNLFNSYMNISQFNDGMYMLKLYGKDTVYQTKILKKK